MLDEDSQQEQSPETVDEVARGEESSPVEESSPDEEPSLSEEPSLDDETSPEEESPPAEEPSLDEAIAALPIIENHPAPESPDAALVEGVVGGLTWIPFAIYLGLWIVLAGVSAYLLYDVTADQPARWMPEYVPLLWSGVGLTAFGPVLSLVVWVFARSRRPVTSRRGLFASAMTRGAIVAFFGVVIWIATLFALEVTAAGGIS